MNKVRRFLFISLLAISCQSDFNNGSGINLEETPGIDNVFGGNIDFDNLPNYANQFIPNYINEDNTNGNDIRDEIAILGRVLFYDKKLSTTNTVSCASCHQQAKAFGDEAVLSEGANGLTARHSMRLINARFSDSRRFFWDERANTLEQQTTMPIQDHAEMGYSGQNGGPGLEDLILILQEEDYYQELFTLAFGDTRINETRMQTALAQFIRSIQSFDSPYDIGRALANNNNAPFSNFTDQENLGKELFMRDIQFQGNSGNRVGGGLGCQDCHQAPEFDIRGNSDNNGVIAVAGNPGAVDFSVTRSPSLRDMFNPQGISNGPFMHTGGFNIDQVINHYNNINANGNNNLDNRLARGGGQNLNITTTERAALIAFIKTLSGSSVYTDSKWSDPFNEQ